MIEDPLSPSQIRISDYLNPQTGKDLWAYIYIYILMTSLKPMGLFTMFMAWQLHLFQTQNDFMVICNVAKILELVVPLMEHPSETFLATIEEDLMKLIIKYGMTVSF